MRELRSKLEQNELSSQLEINNRIGQLKLEGETHQKDVIEKMRQQQEQMVEEHRRAMDEENKLTIDLMLQLTQMQSDASLNNLQSLHSQHEDSDEYQSQDQHHSCHDWRCQICNPPPVTDDDYGPPVFDPYFKCWTFPYAQPKQKQKKVVVKKKDKPSTHNMEVQVDYNPDPSPVKKSIQLQTVADMTTATFNEQSAQTNKVNSRAIQTLEQAKAPPRFTDEKAIRIIQKLLKKIIMVKRMNLFRSLKGILYSRKYIINKLTGSLNILSLHMVCNYTDEACQYLNITIFDYVTRKFTYSGKYEHLEFVKQFNGHALLKLAEPSLKLVDFEDSPFTEHIGCLQSVIHINREHDMISLSAESSIESSSSSSASYEQSEPATPEPIYKYLQPQLKDLRNISTQVGVIRTIPPVIVSPKIQTPKQEQQSEPSARIATPEPVRTIYPDIWYMYYIALRWKLLYHIRWHMRKKQKLLYRANRTIPCCKDVRHFNVELWKVFKQKQDEVGFNFYYKLSAQEYQSSFRRSKKKQGKNEPYRTFYHQLRLPGDFEGDLQQDILKCYLDHAVILKLDQETCKVNELKLLRIKIYLGNYRQMLLNRNKYLDNEVVPFPVATPIGCNLKLQFLLDKELLCKVYRRVRWANQKQKNRKYKDWKVKVLVNTRQEVYDYLVVHKLPCKLSELESVLKRSLEVKKNKKVIPYTIQYVVWKQAFRGSKGTVDVKSQTYYDFNGFDIEKKNYDDRYDYDLDCVYYLSQNAKLSQKVQLDNLKQHFLSRIPQIDYSKFKQDKLEDLQGFEYCPEVEVAKKLDPFYEILVQICVPKDNNHDQCVMYQQDDAIKYSKKKNKARLELLNDNSVYSSEESDPEISESGKNEWAWDPQQIKRIQMDQLSKRRVYRKITCQLTTNKQDQDWFIYDNQLGIWAGQKFANQETVYQYLLAEMCIYQDEVRNKIKEVQLKISDIGSRYTSDQNYTKYLQTNNLKEHFLAQDTYKWKNQDFANSVFLLDGTDILIGGEHQGGYLVESVHISRTYERAYRYYKNLGDMRSAMLTSYIDEELELYSELPKKRKKQKDEQIGKAEIIKAVKFKADPDSFIQRKKKQELRGSDYDDEYDSEEENEQIKNIAPKVLTKWKAWIQGQKIRKIYQPRIRIFKIIQGFLLSGDKQSIYVLVKKYKDNGEYQFVIYNQINQKKRDDIQFINSKILPASLDETSPQEQFEIVFQYRLNIIWTNSKLRIRKIDKAEFDFSKQQIKKQQTELIASIEVEPEPLEPAILEAEIPEKMKDDVEMLKRFLKKLQEAVNQLQKGVDEWWTKFDVDKSNMIEFDEFLRMLEDLELFLQQRNVYLLFHLFDEDDLGYFTKRQFEDLIYEIKKPDFVKVVQNFDVVYQAKLERLQNPKKPTVIKTKEYVEVPEQIFQEKIIYNDKIVYEDVIVKKQITEAKAETIKQKDITKEIKESLKQIEGVSGKPQEQVVVKSQVTESTTRITQDKVIQEQSLPQQSMSYSTTNELSREKTNIDVTPKFDKPTHQQQTTNVQVQKPTIAIVQTQATLIQEDHKEIIDQQNQPEPETQNFVFQPFKLDQEASIEESNGVEKVQLPDLKLQLQDLFLPLATTLKQKRMKPEQAFKKYDVNNSQQLSVQEAEKLFREIIQVELTQPEKSWLLQSFKKEFHASEISKISFIKLIQTKAVRKFNQTRAEEAFRRLKAGLAADFEKFIKRRVDLIDQDNQVCLRNFKVILKDCEYLNQLEIDSLTAYLHNQLTGFIKIDDFYAMGGQQQSNPGIQQESNKQQQQNSSQRLQIIDFYDIIKPFKHIFAMECQENRTDYQQAIDQLFKDFDGSKTGKKSMLLSSEEFAAIIQKYCKYKVDQQETQVIKEYFENNFQRKEIKRNEFSKLLTQNWPRRFDASEARTMYLKLRKPLGEVKHVKQLFQGAVESNNNINLRNFKKCIEQLTSMKQGDKLVFQDFFRNKNSLRAFNAFTQYLEKADNGFIKLDTFDKVDLNTYLPEEVQQKAEAQELFTYSTFRDIVKDMSLTVYTKDFSYLFDQYDRDKSKLLSHEELARICDDYGLEIDEAEKKVLEKGLKATYGRTHIKKAEFFSLFTQKQKRFYDEGKAREVLGKLFYRGMTHQQMEQFKSYKNTSVLSLRNFKKMLQANYQIEQEIDSIHMDNLAQYLEKNEDGSISLDDLKLAVNNKYQPVLEKQQQIVKERIEVNGVSELLLPLKTTLKQRNMNPGDLADIYDKDKNFLLSSDELNDVILNFTGYQLNSQEKGLLLQNIKKLTGTTGMRSQLKREEISKLFEMVDDSVKLATKDQQKEAIKLLKELKQQQKQWQENLAKFKDKQKLTVCELRNMLLDAGVADINLINTVSLFAQDPHMSGFVKVATLLV